MPMRNPPHPGRGLKDDIDALGLTVAEAADALGITRQQHVARRLGRAAAMTQHNFDACACVALGLRSA